jgi:hypothetical protein
VQVQLQGECEVYWIIENVRNTYRLTEIAMEDMCSNDVHSFTQRVITGAPVDIFNYRSRLAYDGQDHVFMSDGLDLWWRARVLC